MYFQFCYYIQKDEEKRRATMHIKRKLGVAKCITGRTISTCMECCQSGISQSLWCRAHGIMPSTFYNWVTRLEKEDMKF